MLNELEVVSYLLERGLLRQKDFVNGNVAVVNTSRRNHNFQVLSPSGSYQLKQAVGPDRVATISREAALYQALHSEHGAARVARYLPKFRGYDSEQSLLILEFVHDVETIRERQERAGTAPASAADEVAEALAALHSAQGVNVAQDWDGYPQKKLIRNLREPELKILATASGAELQAIETVQSQKSLCVRLEELDARQSVKAFIHGDVRGDNFLIPRKENREGTGLKLVDFEFAGWGDAAWDVGAVFAEYLSYWIFSTPIVGGATTARMMRLASMPLERVQAPMRAFWRRYVRAMKLEGAEFERFLRDAVDYCGVRLLCMVIESGVSSASLGPVQRRLLQIAANILLRPERAVEQLLGIANARGGQRVARARRRK
jgi:thiamine kinase-like enzyme